MQHCYCISRRGRARWVDCWVHCVEFSLCQLWSESGLVWISNGGKEVGLQMVRILNVIWNLEAKPFVIWKKCTDFEWSEFQMKFKMVGTIVIAIAKAWPFENWNIWNQTFKKSGFKMFLDFKWSDFGSPAYWVTYSPWLFVNQVHFDGWEMDFDYWTSPNSPYIHPLGWCEQNGVKLNPPKGKK